MNMFTDERIGTITHIYIIYIAGIAAAFAECVPFSQATTDPVEDVAKSLKVIYNNSSERTDDGNDFAGDRN